MLKLHFAPNSRATRVVWLFEELGLDYELVRYELAGAEMRTPEFRKMHPMGRVPILEDGSVTLYESAAILEYILARHGARALRPNPDDTEFPAYLQWLHYAEGMLMPPVNSYMVETVFLPPERRSEVHAKRALKLLGHMLRAVDTALVGREFLAGGFSAADIMTGSASITAANIGVDLGEMPELAAYVERLRARPAFQKAQAI